MRNLYLWTVLALILNACTVTNNVNFNEDFSGKASMTVNYKMYLEFMGKMMVPKGEEMNDVSKDKQNKSIEGIAFKLEAEFNAIVAQMDVLCKDKCLSNFKTIKGEQELSMTYDFENIQALNFAISAFEVAAQKDATKKVKVFEFFTLKGSKLNYVERKLDESSSEQMGQFAGQSEMFENVTVLHFAKPVKKITSEGNVGLSKDSKTLTFKTNLNDYMKGNLTSFNLKF